MDRLTCQGSFFSNISKLFHLNRIWSISQSKLPKNIFNFTVHYINNTLPTRKNLNRPYRRGISSSSDCSFCLNPETPLHVVAGCQQYLERFTWRHDSILNFVTQTFQSMIECKLFVDLPGLQSPSIITGDEYRPDLLLSTPNNNLYMVELTAEYESNLANKAKRKREI